MARRLIAALPLVAFLGFAGAVANNLYREATSGYSPSELPSALIGENHPPLALPGLQGFETAALDDEALKGEVTIVNVFASWCVPCHQEHSFLMQLAQDRRVKIVGIDYKDDPADAIAFLRANGNPYSAIGIDRSGRRSIDWGVYGVPETFLVDRDGRIAFKFVGPLNSSALTGKLRPSIERLLADSASRRDRPTVSR
ncbi:DsbE family thiol:disulfide interchange protein [Rhizobium leguminosarum]|uniref:DsbE family thiol:disulfide interchange protein n=1 Tax=Rhizobium TaxID=379 RepID=UPI001441C96C|nr:MULTISPECIES: DsbE family thiol:disulfide interchange protein [Rhizobium]MBY3239794.1 DsbE family thiol:disulfide interchange protein [Rhizobium laguerreae]MBY5841863.1 DsbE family thiol:disulfide interchange protein [Rhizobium leguminosarum]MBY5870383.1 DsbE family thiol:disulfide interchange protein [Rhizobium leguminosarum]NKM04721.1 DsbE family thiol:disulfide interchange protein [Rhizobium leguminosarum bv. viciae]NKM76653.1 DsbE family thiol:disulfide interchange protein [Rhizobium le